ncbi:MAG: hypothetical protein IKU36_04425 [Bacteroidales bacterium]|nr:hypothetical protein [Bacteroidales bacterium]
MKKTLITIILAAAALGAHAQTAYDALLFSENEYEGTARTMAMGNAFTALGGDLGAVGINPAGSAVAKYSQFILTPALTISTATSQGVSPFQDGYLPYFERQMKSSRTRFGLPNFGLSINWDTNRTSGLKNMSFGFIINRTATYDEDIYASGTNSTTSFMGSMAYDATVNGYLGAELNAENAYNYMPWMPVVGYQSGMISTFGGYDDQFVGASEIIFDNGEVALGGPLKQSYGRQVTGGKYEYLFNIGANISDFIYLGVNLGMTALNYDYNEYFREVAIDPADFEIVFDNGDAIYFDEMIYKYSYAATGNGYFAKFGAIVTPGHGLRIGAAIQTPVLNNITEYWQEAGETAYTNSQYNAGATSPEGRGSYTMVSPLRANFGIAYTLGKIGAVSVDYEFSDYGQMRYKGSSYDDRDYFEAVNADIRERFGISHMLRAGLEFRPVSELAVRAGYGLTTGSEKYYSSLDGELSTSIRQNVSLGLGYSSKKSFFTDFAVRRTIMPDEYFMPYGDYMFDTDGNIVGEAYAPELINKKGLWKVLLTFGWRF